MFYTAQLIFICVTVGSCQTLECQNREGYRGFPSLKNKIWANKSISISVKIRIYKVAVITVLTYGCEVWNTTLALMKRIESCHLQFLRRILKISCFHLECLTRTFFRELELAHWKLAYCLYETQMVPPCRVVRMPSDRLPRYMAEWVPLCTENMIEGVQGNRGGRLQRRILTTLQAQLKKLTPT